MIRFESLDKNFYELDLSNFLFRVNSKRWDKIFLVLSFMSILAFDLSLENGS